MALCRSTTSSTPGDVSRKEERDLCSLGVLREAKGAERFTLPWPKARVFLVVSTEFAGRLRTRRWTHLHYELFEAGPRTVVAEVLPGSPATPRVRPSKGS
nr:hypothetical protein [Deltaproteobacteria bacterium]